MRVIDTIILHHPDDPSRGEQYQKTFVYHNRGAPRPDGTLQWNPGRGISYAHFLERNGKIISGDEQVIRYHAGKWNTRSLGVCVAGRLSTEKMTHAQVNSLVEVIDGIKRRHNIKHIYNHYEVRPTNCPVINMRDVYLRESRKRLGLTNDTSVRGRIRRLQRLMKDANENRRGGYKRGLTRLKNMLKKDAYHSTDCCPIH